MKSSEKLTIIGIVYGATLISMNYCAALVCIKLVDLDIASKLVVV